MPNRCHNDTANFKHIFLVDLNWDVDHMLKSLLNRAKNVFEAKVEPTRTVAEPPKYQQHLDLIVVPQSAMDAYPEDPNPLVEATVSFVNFLHQQAQFNRFEIPAEATQIYHTDYYLAQVTNGGHAQFVGNAAANLAYTMADVTDALRAMDATEHLKLVKTTAAWVAKNPDEADAQTGLDGGISPELAALDKPFYALEKTEGLRSLMADWIAELEIVQVVEDQLMPRVLEGIKTLNPNRRSRQSKSHIARLVNQLSNPLFLGLGMAGAAAKEIEPVVYVGNGSHREVDGTNQMTWFVQTTSAKRFGIATKAGVELRDYVDQNGQTMPDSLQDTGLEHITSFKPVSVGQVTSSVARTEIDAVKSVCEKLNAPIAIEMLLSRLPKETTADFVSVRSTGRDEDGNFGASFYVVANRGTVALSAIVEHGGARLLSEPEHTELVQVSDAEIAEFTETLKAD